MKMLKKSLLLSLVAAAAAPAFAYEAGDVIVRAGAAMVSPDVGTDAALAGFDVEENTQLGLTATYMISPNFGVELLAATPYQHDITASGTTIGSTKHLPPTVSAQWYPLAGNASVQPYVGAGLNHTLFFSEEITAIPGATLKLSDSTSWAVEAGVDVKINDQLLLNVAVWKVDINTDVSVNGTTLGELEIDPFAAMIGLGMKF